MLQNTRLLWVLMPLTLVLQIAWAKPATPPVINMHESVEDMQSLLNLQETTGKLGIQKTVLQGIPEDILYYTGDKNLSLADSKENNELLIQIFKQSKPSNTFEIFCSIDPLAPNRLEEAEDCFAQGATGIKLYNGYTYAHVLPVDDPRLGDLYQKISDEGKVLMLALNSGEYQGQLENVLNLYPNLDVICPHYCLASQQLSRLRDLMARFPNLYVDTSFGKMDLTQAGFEILSANHEDFVKFFIDFQDRILFGTDNVVTSYEAKDSAFLNNLYQAYIDMLTKEEVSMNGQTLKGLALPYSVQRKVFWRNAANLLQQ